MSLAMTLLMGLPLAVAVLLRLIGARVGRRLPPATAVRLLTVAALVTALATGFVLAVAALFAAAALPPVAALGHWSAAAFRAGGLPTIVGVAAGLAVAVLLAAALRRAARASRDLAYAAWTCRRLGPGTAGLVVVEDDHPDAYALPGLGGRVVVSTAMLRALPAEERRVLLAHEQAHLTHRHYLYVQLTELAAAANPLLRPLAAAVRAGAERWADEAAATDVGDRQLVARALARAGLAQAAARQPTLAPASALRSADYGVAARARALLTDPPPPRRALASAVLTLVVVTAAAAALTAHDTEHRFEQAQAVYATTAN